MPSGTAVPPQVKIVSPDPSAEASPASPGSGTALQQPDSNRLT
jgi:hypothetical protein